MRLLTYLFAAAVLWAVASSGPATSTSAAEPSAGADHRGGPTLPPQRSLSAYPR